MRQKKLKGADLIKHLVSQFITGKLSYDDFLQGMNDKSITKSALWVFTMRTAIADKQKGEK